MKSDTLQNALEQNRENIKQLLDALDADYEYPEDPERDATMSAAFTPGDADAAKDVELSEGERVAWMFLENTKAIEAAAEAAGADANTPEITESKGMKAVKDALGGVQ